jgi:prolyl-tRNA synthetase
MYRRVYREWFALPGYIGEKSPSERFAGADSTLTYESLMPGGKALQASTSHNLGQNFAKAFDITFQSKEGAEEHVWQTSWGFSTRSLGGLIMAHGDDLGLVLPPRLAPTQVVILPVRQDDAILDFCHKLTKELKSAGIRALVDARDGESFGFRINKWELRGAPIRFEIGGKEVEDKTVTFVRRDDEDKEKQTLPAGRELSQQIQNILDQIQASLLESAEAKLKAQTYKASTYDEFKKIMDTTKGFIWAPWCEHADCETAIKAETTATTRCLPLDEASTKASGKCVRCDKPAKHIWLFAQSY